MIKKQYKGICLLFIAFVFVASCNNTADKKDKEAGPLPGNIYLSADESFRPVLEEQIKVFESAYPQTRVIATYKPEAACLKDYFRDTLNNMVIITRGLTEREDKYMYDSLGYHPSWDKVATDAVALLVNSKSDDTLYTINRLQQHLTGEAFRDQPVVFDGLSATSAVRFISDSIVKGKKFDTSVVKAAKNSLEVIDFIAGNEKAIGLVGISWIGNPEDTAQLNKLKKVKIAYVQCGFCKGQPFVKPLQESIGTRRYPLVRGLYYITKENYYGPAASFAAFLKSERGQLIFKRAYLGTVMDFDIRRVKLNSK